MSASLLHDAHALLGLFQLLPLSLVPKIFADLDE